MKAVKLSRDGAVWTLGSLCRFHSIPFSPALFLQRFTPSPEDCTYSIADIGLAAEELGLDADQLVLARAGQLAQASLPCLVFRDDGASVADAATPLLAVAVAAGQVTYFEFGSDTPPSKRAKRNSCTCAVALPGTSCRVRKS